MKSLRRIFSEHENWFNFDNDSGDYWNTITGEMEDASYEYVSDLNPSTWSNTVKYDIEELLSYCYHHGIMHKTLRNNIIFSRNQFLICIRKQLERDGRFNFTLLQKDILKLLGVEYWQREKEENDDIFEDVSNDILRKFGNRHTYRIFVENNRGSDPDTVAKEYVKIVRQKNINIKSGDWRQLIVPHFQKIKLITIEYSAFLKHIRKYK